MNKLSIIAIMALMLVSVVSATTTTLSDNEISMDYNDVRTVEFCLTGVKDTDTVVISVDKVCKDLDNQFGCQAGDASAAGLFSVTPAAPSIMNGECVELTLATTIANEADGGVFYYNVNGAVGGSLVGMETGSVLVPEFGVIAAIGVLALAGVYIYKKRD